MKISKPGIFAIYVMSLICGAALPVRTLGAQAGTPDIVLYNGKVLTVDNNFSIVQAVAVTSNKISAVGSDQEVLQKVGPNTMKIDLKGRTVVPGLIDTHLHITGPASYAPPIPPETRRQFSIEWRGVTKKEDVLAQVRSLMTKFHPPKGAWLAFSNNLQARAGTAPSQESGEGAEVAEDQVKILYSDLSKTDLDQVLPDNPAIFTMGIPDENALFVNSMALNIILKEHGDLIKKYGRLRLGTNGLPDGHLEPPATRLILNLYAPRMDAEWMADGIEKQLQELNSQGHTTISTKLRTNSIDAYKLLEQRSQQTVRLAYGPGFDYFGSYTDLAKDLKQYQGIIGSGSDWDWAVSFGPSSMDGGGTRACTNQKRAGKLEAIDDYFPMGQCHTDDEYRGGPRSQAIAGNYFKDWLMVMGRYNLRLANDHVAGDRTVSNLLNIIEQVQKQYGPNSTKNWAFDHCRYVDPKDFARAAKLGVMFSCAPKYVLDSVAVSTAFNANVANNFIMVNGKIIFIHTDFANEYNLRPDGALVSTYKELKARRSGRGEAIVGEGGG